MNPRMAAFSVLVAVGASVLLTGCNTVRRPDQRKYQGLDKRLDQFTYVEEGKLVALAVSTQAARYRENEKYIPLTIGMANKSAPTLRMTRESFLLYDESGKRYPMAPVSEIIEHYRKRQLDLRLTTFFQIWNAKWPVFNRVSTSFFPGFGSGVAQDFVELPPAFYFAEHMYFPHPEGEILGHRFELHVTTDALDDPVFVKFLVD